MDNDFRENVQMLAIQFVPFFMAVVFHEYAHGFIANKWGDSTAKEMGRLTLNPLPHVDLLGTIVFPVIMMLTGINFLFGWAKPVPINPTRFRKYRPGLFWVSCAGPAMNFLLAFFSAACLCALIKFLPQDFSLFEPLVGMAKISVYLNYALGIFNLLPLPPLDGSKIIESFLSYNATKKFEMLTQYSFFILMALLLTGALNVLSVPINLFSRLTLALVARLFGLGVF